MSVGKGRAERRLRGMAAARRSTRSPSLACAPFPLQDPSDAASWGALEKKAAAADKKRVREGGTDDEEEERKSKPKKKSK